MAQGKGETSTVSSVSKLLHSAAAYPELIFLLSYVGGFSKNMCFCDQPHLGKIIHNNLLLKIHNL